MRERINCPNPPCMAKNSMVSILYHNNKTKADKLAFTICLKCSFPGPMNNLPTDLPQVKIFVVGLKQENLIEGLRTKHTPKCFHCNNSRITLTKYRKPNKKELEKLHKKNPHKTIEDLREHTGIPYEITKSCMTKLFIESNRLKIERKFIGYFCEKCETIFFIQTIPKIKWNPISWLDQSGNYFNEIGCYRCSDKVWFAHMGGFITRSAPSDERITDKIPKVSKAQIRKIVREELTRLGLYPGK